MCHSGVAHSDMLWFCPGNRTITIPQSTRNSTDSGDCSNRGVSSKRSVCSESSVTINKQTESINKSYLPVKTQEVNILKVLTVVMIVTVLT